MMIKASPVRIDLDCEAGALGQEGKRGVGVSGN